jgi:hypothetical protein
MINTILEVLVAVVVLIVIIAVLALRYLRADDSGTFDDIPDEPPRARRSAEPEHDQVPVSAERRPRQPEPATAARAADRPAVSERRSSGYRDRDSRDTDTRGTGPQVGRSRRDGAGARPVRAARPADADSVTSSWDSLSDVDYWTELAADKPSASTAAGKSAAGRARGEQHPDSRPPAAARPASRPDQGQLPVRQLQRARGAGSPQVRPADQGQTEQFDVRAAQRLGRYGGEAPSQSPDQLGRRGAGGRRTPSAPRPAAARRPDASQRPSTGPRPVQPPAQSAPPNGHGRLPGPGDDDPLTSPSFPAINASDSRSYRTRRSASRQQGVAASSQQPNGRPGGQAGFSGSDQFTQYQTAPDRAISRPDGYPVQPPGMATPVSMQQPAAQAPPWPAASAQPTAPAANPYGSYVSAPQQAYAEPGYQQADSMSTPAPGVDAAVYNGGYPTGPQVASSNGWYGAPAVGGSTGPVRQPQPGLTFR